MKHQRMLKEGSSSCRCSMTSHGDQKTARENAIQMINSILYLQEDSEQDNGHFSGPGSEKMWSSISEDSPQGEWDRMTEKMMMTLAEKRTPSLSSHESIVQRSDQEQRRWKIFDPLLCRPGHDYNCFSHNYFCKSAQSLRCSRRNV